MKKRINKKILTSERSVASKRTNGTPQISYSLPQINEENKMELSIIGKMQDNKTCKTEKHKQERAAHFLKTENRGGMNTEEGNQAP